MSKSKLLKVMCLLVTGIITASSCSLADMHIVKEVTRYSDGGSMMMFSFTIDTWITKDKEYRANNHRIRVTRYDLNKYWYIDMQSNTYRESPIDAKPYQEGAEEKLHDEGFKYEPEYDWLIEDTGEELMVSGIRCRKFILDGDAHFSEKVIEIWVAEDIGVDVGRYEKIVDYLADFESSSLVADFVEMEGKYVLYEKVTTKIPLVPKYILESKISTLEEVSPPPGIYELPRGLERSEGR